MQAQLGRGALRECELISNRHCEEQSDEAIQLSFLWSDGLLRFARNDGGVLAVEI
jgi:hypothetical protein